MYCFNRTIVVVFFASNSIFIVAFNSDCFSLTIVITVVCKIYTICLSLSFVSYHHHCKMKSWGRLAEKSVWRKGRTCSGSGQQHSPNSFFILFPNVLETILRLSLYAFFSIRPKLNVLLEWSLELPSEFRFTAELRLQKSYFQGELELQNLNSLSHQSNGLAVWSLHRS